MLKDIIQLIQQGDIHITLLIEHIELASAKIHRLQEDPTPGGIRHGIEAVWIESNAHDWVRCVLRIHEPSGKAPTGSNASMHWHFRLLCNDEYIARDGVAYAKALAEPWGDAFVERLVNETHIPVVLGDFDFLAYQERFPRKKWERPKPNH